jgi:soluble lytic murein transglycosylase-like protein
MLSCDFRMTRFSLILAVIVCALAASAGEARAEIIVLTSGRTLTVRGHQIKGDAIVLMLRGGGDITCDRSLVAKILQDEVPHPEPTPAADPKGGSDQQAPDATSLLQATPYGEIIAAMSEAHGVDPLLVRALIQVESNYKPRARSPKGAMGLMQLMPSTARTYNVRNPFDPKANIEAGIKHLKSLIDRFNDVKLALASYNAGQGAVEKFNGVPPYRETKSYVSRILALAGIQ